MPRALPSQPRPSHVDLHAWAVEWHSRNRLDGDRRHLIWDPIRVGPGSFRLFRTRAECRAFIEDMYGYIRHRPDLQREPHGWRMPQAVKVRVQRMPRGLATDRAALYDAVAAGGSRSLDSIAGVEQGSTVHHEPFRPRSGAACSTTFGGEEGG